jgi:hypothetical protein
MSTGHWISVILVVSHLIYITLSLVVVRHIWRASPPGLPFGKFYRLSVSFNLRSNFGRDLPQTTEFRNIASLRVARRYCVTLAQAWVFSLIFTLFVFSLLRSGGVL